MASRGVNKVILVGNLGQDPEVRYMPNGGAVANITLATSESWRDKATGEQKEKTEWHRVVLFGKLAEVAGEYLRKGSQVYIEGALQTRKWTDQAGVEKYTTEVVVNVGGTMQMLVVVKAVVLRRVVVHHKTAARKAVGVSLSNHKVAASSAVVSRLHARLNQHQLRNHKAAMSHQWISTTIFRSDLRKLVIEIKPTQCNSWVFLYLNYSSSRHCSYFFALSIKACKDIIC